MGVDVTLSDDTRELLERSNLRPLWEVEEDGFGQRPDLVPAVWHWADIERATDRIAEDVPIADLPPGFRRRVAVPVNPAYDAAVSHSIYVGVQTVSPGETAPSHRHGANAMRVAIEGDEDVRTVVAGEEFPMTDNALVTTPQWEWHDHVNESDETAVWLDVLDLPLVFDSLNVGNVFEDHADERQTVDKPPGYHASLYGGARPPAGDDAIPGPFSGDRAATPPFSFDWADTDAALDAQAANDDARSRFDGTTLGYVNPASGEGPLFPTIGVHAQRVGSDTDAHLHNATEVYYVVEGAGETEVEDATLDWGERDLFVVPPNAPHAHNPDGEATLLSFSDRPMLSAINFYHEREA